MMTTTVHPERWSAMSRRMGGLAAAFGRLTGRTPDSAAQRISGNQSMKDEFKTFAIACRNAGRLDILLGYALDLQTIVEQMIGTPQPLTLELVQKAQEADATEDVKQLQYHQTRTAKDLSMLIRAKQNAVTLELAEIAALRSEEIRLLKAEA